MIGFFWPLVILAVDTPARTDHAYSEAKEIARWDFEDADDRNYDGWPDGWTRRRGRGFPQYLEVSITDDPATPSAAGGHYLRIQLDGGAAEIYSPFCEISSQFSYTLEAVVNAQGLNFDEAYVSITFSDSDHQPLEVHESTRFKQTKDWARVNIGPIAPRSKEVRWARIALHLRPTHKADLSGAAMFDGIWFGRLPRMSLETKNELNVYTDPDDVEVTCRVSGFAEPNPKVRFELLDVWGQELLSHDQPLQSDEREDDEDAAFSLTRRDAAEPKMFAGSATWRPTIPDNGYYQIRGSVPGHTGRMIQNIAVIDSRTRSKEGEFGWVLPDGDDPIRLRNLTYLLSQAGVHWVKFPVWYEHDDKDRAEELAQLAERLNAQDIQLIGMLDQPPESVRSLFAKSENLTAASVFEEPELWRPALDPVMTRLSLKVRWWQLGGDRDTSFVNFPGLEAKINEIREDLNRFGQVINVGMAWRSINETPAVRAPPWAFLSYIADPPLTADELHAYLSDVRDQPIQRWILLEPLPRSDYDLPTRVRDMVVRMLVARRESAEGIFVPDPFDAECGLMNPDGSPGELLLPWRTTATLTAGAEYAGSIQLPNGSQNLVFIRGEEAMMVVWNESPVRETIHLGENVHQVDVWGRTRKPSTVVEEEFVRQTIEVGRLPTFITGVNPFVARWRMAFQFQTKELASVFGQEQTATYRFRNTFAQGVGGTVTLQTPNVWEVDRRQAQFKLAAGEDISEAYHVLLGASASSGQQPLRVDFKINSVKHQFSVYRSVYVGLRDVEIELTSRLDEYGNLVVEQHLTNKSDRFVSFKSLLFVPDRRRERRQVFNVGRGRTSILFVLPDGEELLGKTLWLRAEEIGGARLLNHHITAHE